MSQLILKKRLSPTSPDSEKISIFAKPDGKIYSKDNLGNETLLSNDLTTIIEHESKINPHPQYVLKVNLEKTEYRTITEQEIMDKKLSLSHTPLNAANVKVDVKHGGGPQFFGEDFTVDGTFLKWEGYGLEGILSSGDKIRIVYTST